MTPRSVTLGEFVVGKLLGEGGFGKVYRAEAGGFGTPLAVKFFDPHPFQKDIEAAKTRFVQEAEILFRLKHPYIPTVFRVGMADKRHFILMEYFDGFNLQEARKRVPNPDPIKYLGFLIRVCDAVGYAHAAGIVHRDIKPTNLMSKPGDARVLDFGVAAFTDPQAARLTRTGATIVGDAYSAPELTENPRQIHPRTDVYSIASCWVFSLTGVTPKGKNLDEVMASTSNIPESHVRVIRRCLDSPDRRYQSAAELGAALRSLHSGNTPTPHRDEITHSDKRLLAVMANEIGAHGGEASVWQLNQQLATDMPQLSMGISVTRLQRLGLITSRTEGTPDESRYLAFTKKGTDFIEQHEAELVRLLLPKTAGPVDGTFLDDLPF